MKEADAGTPTDVRLMNAAALLLFVLAAVTAGVGIRRLLQLPAWGIQHVYLAEDTAHHNAADVRMNLLPEIDGNFFTLKISAVREILTDLPWVKFAQVRRIFPDALSVRLEEYVPAAYWGGGGRMTDGEGNLFEADALDVERTLPHLSGPDEQVRQVLEMYAALATALPPESVGLRALELLPRGGWRAQLDSGTAIELGHGTPDELRRRLTTFAATVGAVAARYGVTPGEVETADFRYPSGYALRLRGSPSRIAPASVPAATP